MDSVPVGVHAVAGLQQLLHAGPQVSNGALEQPDVCVYVGLGERLGLLGMPGSAHTHRKRVRVHAGGNCRAWQAMAKHEATTTVLGYMRSGALSNDTLLRYSAR